jgi:PKD repeat protein
MSMATQVLNGLNVFKSSGVIQGPLDVDFFRITASAGAVTVNLSPDLKDPNLDALVTLRNAAGTQLAVANPVDALNAVLQFNLPAAGTYFVSVQGTGKGSPLTTGYSSYGSIGSYSLEITAPIAPATPLPVASISASPASGRAPLAVTFSGALSSGSGTLRYSWDFGDGTSSSLAVPSRKTYNLPGNYTVVLRVTDGGGMSATASTTIQATAAPTARTMGVQSIAITGVLVSPNRPDAYARAIVTVRDNLGAPVPNAKVFGRWSGIVSSNLVAVTNTSGQASLSSPSTPFVGTFSFAVTNITATGYVYNIQSNQISGRSINF